MSRIEDALRIAGRSQSIAAFEGNRQTFSPPWSFEGGGTAAATPEHEPTPIASVAVVERESLAPAPAILTDDRTLPITGFAPEWASKLATSPNASAMLREQFRRLAASMFHAQSVGRLKIVMVTSPWAGDGKTMTALNLSLVLSESYRRRVLLVDADLRRPSISSISKLVPTSGLSDGLKSGDDRKLSVVKISENLTLLPAGRPDPDPMSGLTSRRMQRILDEASANFDWVILDAPPVGPVVDANLLAAMSDAVLLVIRAGKTQHGPVQKAIESLGRDRIFGVVLNGIDELAQSQHASEYGHYYTSPVESD